MADPYTTPIPGATGYESATLAAKTAYQNALVRLNQQRGDTLRQYGYAGDIDPTSGTISNVRVDANLPYGEYQRTRQTHADQYQAARDAAAERGFTHGGGLAAKAITRLRSGFGADDAALGQGLSGALAGFQDQQNQSKYQYDSALAEAQLQAARDAIAAQQFNQANLDGLDVQDGPDWGSLIAELLNGYGPTDSPPGPSAVDHTPDAVDRYLANNPTPKLTKPAAKPAAPKPAPKPTAPKPAAPKPTPAPAPAKKTTKKGGK